MLRRNLTPARRAGVVAGPAGALLVASLLTGTPAAAAGSLPDGDFAQSCADDAAAYCIAEATITPVGGVPVPLAELGLTASAATLPDDWTAWLGWSVDGWAEQPAGVTGGEIRLVIRTGSFVPRMTSAVAEGFATRRGTDDTGNTLTVTGRATHVDWITDGAAADCTARQYCGEYDTMADASGTGFRFQGRTQDLEGNSPEFIDALDGAYLATDAQARTTDLTWVAEPDVPYLSLGVLGNPQLDGNAEPVRNALSAWLPGGYFAATGTTPEDALATGFDLAGTYEGMTASIPLTATARDGGVAFAAPEIGFGAAIGELRVYPRPSGAAPGDTAPGAPRGVAVAYEAGEALVSWTAPGSDGGSPVTGYRARVFSAATGGPVLSRCDSDTETMSCWIGNLSDGETYFFTVSAVSALGEGNAAARVEVVAGDPILMPPSEPRAVRAVAGANRLTASWTAPESDGGEPVGYYVAQAYRVATGGAPVATCVADAPRRTCVLTGLLRGAKYYVGVTAVNNAGDSPESAVRASATTWNVAGPPRSVSAKSSQSRVTVTWAAPATTGGSPVNGYRAELYTAARGGSPAVRCTASAAARGCVTATLKPGRVYYATVTAVNGAGASAQPARVKVLVRR